MLRNQNIKSGRLDDTDVLFIDPVYERTFRNKRLQPGDLLTARTGYPGATCVVPGRYASAQSFTTLITRPNRELVTSAFLCHFINSELGQGFVSRSQIGGAQQNINAGTFRLMPIWLPDMVEQSAIVRVLDTADDWIAGLDRLIGKRVAIKQGMVQRLVTGGTRLDGFSEPWTEGTFEQLAEPSRERSMPRAVPPSTPLVDLDQIEGGSGRLIGTSQASEAISLKAVFKPGDVLFGKLRAYLRKYWYADVTGLCTTEIWVLRAKDGVDGRFVRYVVETDQFIDVASGAYGTHMPRSDWGTVRNLTVGIPPLDEQVAIASAISAADAEIAVLIARLEKARYIKQGMMQELLTGRTRLPVAEVSA